MRRWIRGSTAPAFAGGLILFMLIVRACPDLAGRWQAAAALPALGALHRLTARIDAPVLEWLAALLPLCLLAALCLRRPVAAAAPLMAIAACCVLMWYPAYWSGAAEPAPPAAAARLAALCDALIDELNRSPRAFPTPVEAAARAGGVAGMAGARVKCARHPGWMRAMHLAGLFAPCTGEAIIDPDAPPALAPFTAVHELMHLKGIAGEGAANIAAWRRCLAHGGAFADSARLWALKYALAALNRADPTACLRAMSRIDADLAALCRPVAEVAPPAPIDRLCAALGIGEAAASYGDLVNWLALGAAVH